MTITTPTAIVRPGIFEPRGATLKLKNQPERTLQGAFLACPAMPFTRALSHQERLLLAVHATAPTHLLTIDSKRQYREEFIAAWHRLLKRLGRLPQRSRKPLIHLATVARSDSGTGGYHLHALIWEYLHLPVLLGHTRAVGLGRPDIQWIISPGANAMDVFTAAAYVLGQHEPVFGTDHHLRHEPLSRSARRYLVPQRGTLSTHSPKLLAALDRAKDRTVPDEEVLQMIPRFSYRDQPSN